jgi:hypothetical protein
LAREQSELTQEAVPPVDGYDLVFLAEALNDRYSPRLDDEEVAAGVARGKQNFAGLDRAKATQLAQLCPLVVVKSGECTIAVEGFRNPGSDCAVHG